MMPCAFCKKPIEPGTRAVSIVGGLFPVEEQDFFMIDETVMLENHAHLECLLRIVSENKDVVSPASDATRDAGDV